MRMQEDEEGGIAHAHAWGRALHMKEDEEGGVVRSCHASQAAFWQRDGVNAQVSGPRAAVKVATCEPGASPSPHSALPPSSGPPSQAPKPPFPLHL
eukprot:363885-Chlamydomonas_euryale.AAC.17